MVIRGRVRRAVVHVRGTACMVAWLRCDAMLDGERIFLTMKVPASIGDRGRVGARDRSESGAMQPSTATSSARMVIRRRGG